MAQLASQSCYKKDRDRRQLVSHKTFLQAKIRTKNFFIGFSSTPSKRRRMNGLQTASGRTPRGFQIRPLTVSQDVPSTFPASPWRESTACFLRRMVWISLSKCRYAGHQVGLLRVTRIRIVKRAIVFTWRIVEEVSWVVVTITHSLT